MNGFLAAGGADQVYREGGIPVWGGSRYRHRHKGVGRPAETEECVWRLTSNEIAASTDVDPSQPGPASLLARRGHRVHALQSKG
ncbi:hypothetical protein MTO96_004462 [Rhipicephalus appendiculatus]